MNKINGLDEIEIEDNLSSIDWYADAVCTARVRAHCVLNMFVAFSFDKIHNLVSKWLRKKMCRPFAHRLFASFTHKSDISYLL